MSDSASATIAAAAKQRLRREAKHRENYDRISASLSIYDSKASKKPTRIIPDVAGFHILSTAEIKRDTKDIEKNSNFSHQKDRNLNEEMDNLIHRSMRPHCPPESTLMKKKRRLMNWINNPDSIEQEISFWKDNLNNKKENLNQFNDEKVTWTANAHNIRKLLTNALKLNIESNKHLKLNGIELLQLCEMECNNNNNLRKKRSFHAKDLVEEIKNRENSIDIAMTEYFDLLKEAETYADKIGNQNIPTAYVSVEELQYNEDTIYIQHKSTTDTSTTTTSSTTTTPNQSIDSNNIDENVIIEVEVSVKEEISDPILEEKRECISDIPLPYFDSETKQIIPIELKEEHLCIKETDLVNIVNTTNNVNSIDTREISHHQTRNRSGSIGSMKLDTSKTPAVAVSVVLPLVVDSDNNTTTAESSESVTPDSDPSGHKHTTAATTTNGNYSPNIRVIQSNSSKILDEQDLLHLLTTVQDSVKISESTIADAEFIFQDRPMSLDDVSIINTILQHRNKKPNKIVLEVDKKLILETQNKKSSQGNKERLIIPNKDNDEMKSLASHYLALDRHNESEWSAYMDTLFDGLYSQGIVTRKGKKKGPEYLPVCVDPRLQTPRGVNLLFSPLSQYEGRMLGVYHNDTIFQQVPLSTKDTTSTTRDTNSSEKLYTTTVQLPPALYTAEEDALKRCSIQSAAAIADLQLRHIKTSLKEVNKFALEAQTSMRRAENFYEVATVEEGMELRRMYKELVHYGLVSVHDDDPPLSPITSNSASFATSILQNGVYNSNKTGGAKNTRPPVRGNSVTARNTTANATTTIVGVPIAVVDSTSTSSDIATTTSESGSSGNNSSDGKPTASDEISTAGLTTVSETETGKRKASAVTTNTTTTAAVGTSAPKRRR